MSSENCYPIEGTSNRHSEQKSGPYLDPTWWDTWEKDIEEFKKRVINRDKEKKSFTVVRVSHTEFALFNKFIKGKPKVGPLERKHSDGTEKKEDYHHYYTSLNKADMVCTQIGYDFEKWMNDVQNYRRNYNKYKNECIKNHNIFLKNHVKIPRKELMDIPFDVIYGLVASRWFFRTFKNRIGIIGSSNLVPIIKEKMKNEEYQKYLGTDYFTDYITVPAPMTLTRPDLEKNLCRDLKKAKGDIFLLGMGCGKLRVFHLIKDMKSAIYIDIGHGIDALAGKCDLTRPYFGSWKNF
jgi:hypothetical protein